MSGQRPWPSDLAFHRADRRLIVTFEDGTEADIPFELLRVESPSADVQGHTPGGKTIVSRKRGVNVRAAEPVGRYGVRIIFDDGHDSGLFAWDYLARLGRDKDDLMDAYIEALAARGLSRD
jgi:DUF971 family protein